MTAALFYHCCSLGYEANAYEGAGELDPKGLYLAHADGRDEGLREIDENSPTAFSRWFHDRSRFGGHPWEVCRGGNSTHISLYVHEDEAGWWFSLSGSSYGRSVETIKFYLALVRAGFPVFLNDGQQLAKMALGEASWGIVPRGIIPRCCGGLFPGESIVVFMNLPYENTEAIIARAFWYPLEEIRLAT